MLCRAPQPAPESFCIADLLELVLRFCGLLLGKGNGFSKGEQGLQIFGLLEAKQRLKRTRWKFTAQLTRGLTFSPKKALSSCASYLVYFSKVSGTIVSDLLKQVLC